MALTIDSQESGGTAHRGTTSGAALTWLFNNVAGDFLLVGVVLTCQTGLGPVAVSAGPTYNSVAMTLVPGSVQAWSTTDDKVQWYYLANPATGSNTVSVTGTGGNAFAILAGAISFKGAASTPGTATLGTGTGTTATAGAITTASGNFIVADGGWGSGETGVQGTGFTRTFLLNGSGATAGDDILGEYQQSSGSSITPTYTFGVSDSWGISAVEIKVAITAVIAASRVAAIVVQAINRAGNFFRRLVLTPRRT
jgi:hypothetical protein